MSRFARTASSRMYRLKRRSGDCHTGSCGGFGGVGCVDVMAEKAALRDILAGLLEEQRDGLVLDG